MSTQCSRCQSPATTTVRTRSFGVEHVCHDCAVAVASDWQAGPIIPFDRFQASGEYCSDLSRRTDDAEGPGRLYLTYFWIAQSVDGTWATVLGNREFRSPDIQEAEHALYGYVMDV